MSREKRLFRVRFVNQDKIYEIYARAVYQGDIYGFVVIEDLVFDNREGVVVDPGEERLEREFEGVQQSLIPLHAVVRIDQVEKRGKARLMDLDGKVATLPVPGMPPNRKSDG